MKSDDKLLNQYKREALILFEKHKQSIYTKTVFETDKLPEQRDFDLFLQAHMMFSYEIGHFAQSFIDKTSMKTAETIKEHCNSLVTSFMDLMKPKF